MNKPEVLHQWVYVISPVEDELVFAAFCKACRTYFTEPVPFSRSHRELDRYRISRSRLPQFGCVMPNDLTSEPMT